MTALNSASLGSQRAFWNIFAHADHLRQGRGRILQAIGYGPVESPSHVVFRNEVMTLRAYAHNQPNRPAILLIPAPIKRSYILDLAPENSVVRQWLSAGFAVYLLQWQPPGEAAQHWGLGEYADRFLLEVLEVLARKTGREQVVLAGHSLGGTFAAIFAALHPERVKGLVLLSAPLHFGTAVDALSHYVAASPPATFITRAFGNVPGSFLSFSSALAAPGDFISRRWVDRVVCRAEPKARKTYLRVERWTLDEMPFPGKLFREVIEWLYRENRFSRGLLELNSRRALPSQVTCPLVCATEAQSDVSPPQSMRRFYDAASSARKLWV
ncbi:MAG TPA: alpha/beta fold hydrolase, partial [Candidatus Sulfotelmatobacter sp.]|nr:alpha/beta fold hydrolase [Candidatus Sulfotelmatobacter sp.]